MHAAGGAPPAVVARLCTLAPHHTDSQIATMLHQEGASPGLGGIFTASKVAWIRSVYAVSAGSPTRGRQRLFPKPLGKRCSMQDASEDLMAVVIHSSWAHTCLHLHTHVPHGNLFALLHHYTSLRLYMSWLITLSSTSGCAHLPPQPWNRYQYARFQRSKWSSSLASGGERWRLRRVCSRG